MVLKVLHSRPALVPCYPPPTTPAATSGSPSSAAAPAKSNPSYSHHLFETRIPGLRTASSQRSRIGRVAMYCATVFCLLRMYASTSSKPASRITSPKGEYYHQATGRHRGCRPVIRQANLCWNPPRARPMRGVITHISVPKRRTVCTTPLKKVPDTHVLAPSRLKILVRRVHCFQWWLTTACQSLYEAKR